MQFSRTSMRSSLCCVSLSLLALGVSCGGDKFGPSAFRPGSDVVAPSVAAGAEPVAPSGASVVGETNTYIQAQMQVQQQVVEEHKVKVREAEAVSDELVKIIQAKRKRMPKRKYRKWKASRVRALKKRKP